MDRRAFFKTLLATPLLTPLFLASKKTKNDIELYLISDCPQRFIPFIVRELEKYSLINAHSFCFLNKHPDETKLKNVFLKKGLIYEPKISRADMTISFANLQNNVLPSFTLVKSGKIWDIRLRKLYTLWEELNKNHNPVSSMTITSSKNSYRTLSEGKAVSIYTDGVKTERLPLKKDFTRTFQTKNGHITVQVENGSASILESSCKHKICLSTPPITRAGERIICVPNHFLLEIEAENSIDTVIG